MKIALDYDETYTKDPVLWGYFIDHAVQRGHEVMVVTFRAPELEIEDMGIPVYYTSYRAKRKYMESQGVRIDIWIDDSPETITVDSSWTDNEREIWKRQNGY